MLHSKATKDKYGRIILIGDYIHFSINGKFDNDNEANIIAKVENIIDEVLSTIDEELSPFNISTAYVGSSTTGEAERNFLKAASRKLVVINYKNSKILRIPSAIILSNEIEYIEYKLGV